MHSIWLKRSLNRAPLIRWFGLLAACAILFLAVAPAGAQGPNGYPNKPIRLMVPYGAGGVGDQTMRLLANKVSEQVKQQIASGQPYSDWFESGITHLADLADREAPTLTEPLRNLQLAFGYTQEDMKVLLAPTAARAEELGHVLHHGPDFRFRLVLEDAPEPAQPRGGSVGGKRGDVVRDGPAAATRVAGVGPGDGLEQEGQVGYVSGHGTGMVHRRRQRHDAVHAHAPEGRLAPGHTAVGRRAQHRSAGLSAECCWYHWIGDGGRRSAR